MQLAHRITEFDAVCRALTFNRLVLLLHSVSLSSYVTPFFYLPLGAACKSTLLLLFRVEATENCSALVVA